MINRREFLAGLAGPALLAGTQPAAKITRIRISTHYRYAAPNESRRRDYVRVVFPSPFFAPTHSWMCIFQ